MKLYLSGPMSGLPNDNHLAFQAEEARLMAVGFDVVSPARQPLGLSWVEYMKLALDDLTTVDGVALMSMDLSPGMSIEVTAAHRLDLRVCTVPFWIKEVGGNVGQH